MRSRIWLAIAAAAALALAGCGREETYEGTWHRVKGQHLPTIVRTPADIRIVRKDNHTYLITEERIPAAKGRSPKGKGPLAYKRDVDALDMLYDTASKRLVVKHRVTDPKSGDLLDFLVAYER